MPVGKKAAQTHLRPRPRSDHVPALLLVLLIIIALFVVGVAAVKL